MRQNTPPLQIKVREDAGTSLHPLQDFRAVCEPRGARSADSGLCAATSLRYHRRWVGPLRSAGVPDWEEVAGTRDEDSTDLAHHVTYWSPCQLSAKGRCPLAFCVGVPRDPQGCSMDSDVSICVTVSKFTSREAGYVGGLWKRGGHSLNVKTHTGISCLTDCRERGWKPSGSKQSS